MSNNISRVVVISEIGENHIGDMNIAKKLIEQSAEAGVDYVKLQSYKIENFNKKDPEYGWFKKVSLSDAAHFTLEAYAEKCGVKFLSSPFSLERTRFLCENMGLKDIKVASGIMLNFEILDYLNSAGINKIFLSTGMASLKEIELALSHLGEIKNIYLLHCVTQYPCKDDEANLNAIVTLGKTFKFPVGYSDHTLGSEACLAAVALGAKVIEKHFTFDKKCKEGTDHEISLEFEEMRNMVKSIRRIENMLGSGKKLPSVGEKKIVDFVRNRFI